MVHTPYFVVHQPVLRGFGASFGQNGGFRLQTPYFAQTLSFMGVRRVRRVLRRVLETAFEKVLRRVLRRCLAVGFRGRKGSEKGS